MRIRLLLVVVMALWGSAFACSKLAIREIPHEVAGFLRFFLGAVVLLVALRMPRIAVRDFGRVAALGLVGVFGYNFLFFLGLAMAPAADGSVIVPMAAPVITVAVTAVLTRTRLPLARAVGITVAVCGGAVFFLGIPSGGGHRLLGDLLFLAAAACWACYTMLGAPVLARLAAPAVTVYATAIGALALGVVALPHLSGVAWSELGAGFWLNQAYLGVLPTALAYVLYYRAVGEVGPATAASAMFLVPAFGLACAWVLLGESIAPVQALGAALMFAGAWLNTRDGKRRAAVVPPIEPDADDLPPSRSPQSCRA
ncbi:DMT family transporter [Nocardia abscessus]|uniref:DMT family transporter n=1 Tax=Nocardia abscessus TaxID=120957 RepID=UPI002458F78A|nr:DMT family transporter [Nocardia abscessus]